MTPVTRTEIHGHVAAAFGSSAVALDDIIEAARNSGARPELIVVLKRLPSDRTYGHLRDLWHHIGDVPLQ